MATTTPEAPDRIESIQSLEPPIIDVDEKPVGVENLNEQPLTEEKLVSNLSHDSNAVDMSRYSPGQLGSLNVGGNQNAVYPPNYGPQSPTFFFGGLDEYPPLLNVEGLEVGSTGIYNDNHSVVYHTGYGYSQMPYGPYSPVTTPLPSVSGDGQLYSPQHFPFTGGFFQQAATPSMAFLPSSAPISQAGLTLSVDLSVDQLGSLFIENPNANVLLGTGLGHLQPLGSFGRGRLKSPDGTGSVTSSTAASSQPIGTLMSFGQSSMPFAPMVSQQQRYGFGTGFNSYDRGYHGGLYQGSAFGGSVPSFGVNGRSLISLDKSRRPTKGNSSLCGCNNTLDLLTEQNRGPRANKSKNQMAEKNSLNGENTDDSKGFDHKLFNSPQFVTEYKDAKFFIIKSYSEDNVHKSIKYGVWASTPSGNRKLDAAYRQVKERDVPCPIFLLFSVNASAQFCGVAEMTGPVDFEKSVDYWQQDKWSGQFPVKWHIVKDVPNNLFRHIILENNDNKPVTNSRDTQEVKLEQGLEMLSILKKHEYDTSILDDIEFYEEREKAMKERKARQHQHQQALSNPSAVSAEQRNSAAIPGNIVNHFSKTFAEAVRLDEKHNGEQPTNKSNTSSFLIVSKPEDLSKPSIT